MATIAQNIIDRAIQRSSLNNPDIVPITQLLAYITAFERIVYARAARLNPDYFGIDGLSVARAAYTDSWDLATTPGNVFALTRTEVAALIGTVTGISVGTRINLIGLRWPDVDLAPRAYVRGRKVTGYAAELGAASINMVSQLKLFYSPVPAVVAALTQAVTVPDEWTALVELPLARVLALRDRRMDEMASIDDEYKLFLSLFDEAVTVFDHGVRRPLVSVPAVPLTTQPQRG